MRLRRLAFRGLTRFKGPEPVRIDFDALGRGLVALVGRNGEGKTTVLEAPAAALYGRFPTRPGSLYGYATGEDAFIEAEFVNGGAEQLKVRFQIDAERRSIERYLFVNGETVTTGRAKEFQEQVEARFGSLSLFLAAPFAAQNKEGNFLTQARGDRKDLFAELLMLGRIQAMAGKARERTMEAHASLSTIRMGLDDLRDRAAARPAVEAQLGGATERMEAAAGRLETAREEEAAAIATLERSRAHEPTVKALRDAVETARVALRAARDSGLREVDQARDASLQADRRSDEARAAAERRMKALDLLDPDRMETEAHDRHGRAVADLERRSAQLRGALEDGPDAAEAAARLPLLEAARRAVDATERAEREEDAANDAALAEVDRLRVRAKLMEQAPCAPPGHGGWVGEDVVARIQVRRERITVEPRDLAGTCPLLKDAREAKLSIAHVTPDPSKGAAADKARLALGLALNAAGLDDLAGAPLEAAGDRLVALIAVVRNKAARASAHEQARLLLDGAGQERARIDAVLAADLRAVALARDRKRTEADAINTELGEAITVASRAIEAAAQRLADANARATESLRAANERLSDAGMALADAEKDAPPSEAEAQIRLLDAVATRKQSENALRQIDAERAQYEASLKAIDEAIAALPEREGAEAAAAQDVSDWGVLERTLGRDGVQALEIDAAGPEVSKLANELLLACHGGRFSIAFETLREKTSAPGEFSEVFDVRVFDHGTERAVEALSGGERVIVGEAVGLAIAIFNARKSGVQWRTLFRDETAGALDPESAQAYVDMLRRAMGLGGFEQVLFVSHSPEVWQRADARLIVEGGRVTAEAA